MEYFTFDELIEWVGDSCDIGASEDAMGQALLNLLIYMKANPHHAADLLKLGEYNQLARVANEAISS